MKLVTLRRRSQSWLNSGILETTGRKVGTFTAAIAIVFCAPATFAQKPPAAGANLFATSPEEGKQVDTERELPLTRFYETSGLKTAPPGTLVRAEPAADIAVPPGTKSIRILYHTRTATSQDTIASGVVLVPYGQPPRDGWPLLAWSHGTSGVARTCAPSLMKSMFYNWQGLYEYVMLGYAVVATDYSGLGTTGRHAYLDMISNAVDVVYSVPAARAAVPDLGEKWLAIGHSQGGLSVLGVAELEGRIKDPGFLGTVALAGASDVEDSIRSGLQIELPVLNGLMAFWVYGVKTVYPDLDLKDVLTDKALAIYETSIGTGCSEASGAFAVLPTSEMFKPGWNENKYVKEFLARNRPGSQSTYGPLLLLGGGDDVLFTLSAGEKIFQRLCVAGGQVTRRVYPGLGHDPVVYGSFKDQMEWIGARFAGQMAPNECPSN